MTKRYRESVEVVAAVDPGTGDGVGRRSSEQVSAPVPRAEAATNGSPSSPVAPAAFVWRGTTYRVVSVLGHWREDAGYWAGGGMEIPQRDLWRVEARNGSPASGIYELVREQDVWRLDRIWD